MGIHRARSGVRGKGAREKIGEPNSPRLLGSPHSPTVQVPLDLANDLIDRILTVSLTLTPCVQPIEGSLAVGRIEAAVAHLDETIQIVRRAVFTQAQRDEASPRDASAKRHGDLDDIGAQLGTWARQIMNIAEATATKGIAADGTATMHLLDAAHSISRARMALTAALDRAF